ncbi:membrane protein [Caballeronia pedi]|uniref:Membrane protein n=1 Tax=Caballeronia pedi TaxID=1777141 RepID=A0A158DUZ1_9BURK|nr:DUF883 family protein [Caballeronia pedi]SAK97527.1 membrane protein [Caballeronia pedi]
MADNNHTLDPVDALKTKRAGSTYDFPTSARMTSGQDGKPSAKSNDRRFREASQSCDASNSDSSSIDWRASAKARFADVQDAMVQQYRVAADTTDDFVHENPWKAITIAALARVVVGMLASR